MKLTQDRVRELFEYHDGQLIRKITAGSFGVKGTIAGTMRPDGKITVGIDGRMVLIHRVIFLWHHGHMPTYIDHKDLNKLNNRIGNLRPATKAENGRNRSKQRNNTSGHKGVTWDKSRSKWTAAIVVNQKRIYLGRFEDLNIAAKAYAEAAVRYHGEFARS